MRYYPIEPPHQLRLCYDVVMTMTSKFNGWCKDCKGKIVAGELIDWTRENGAKHATPAGCATAKAKMAAAPKVTANGAPIATFIQAARDRGLKFPKARFLAPTGGEMLLSLAGATSKFPGSVQVKIERNWVGRVNTDGTVAGPMTSRKDILSTLDRIAENPAAAAKAYGALMCSCSFCGKALTDEGSVEVGYGPICARHFGLPHSPKGTPALKTVTPSMLETGWGADLT